MRKIYFIILSLVLIIFIYGGILVLKNEVPKLVYSSSHILDSTASPASGSSLFKSTPENSDLANAMISLHAEFTNHPPILNTKPKNNIDNFYKLENLFPDFNSYYVVKTKVANALYTELDSLYSNTLNLSSAKLDTYLKSNTEYLEKNWGINDSLELTYIVDTIKEKNGLKVISCELEESYIYSSLSNTLNFRIIVTLEDNSNLYLGVLINFNEISDYQSYPVIRFYGTKGGLY